MRPYELQSIARINCNINKHIYINLKTSARIQAAGRPAQEACKCFVPLKDKAAEPSVLRHTAEPSVLCKYWLFCNLRHFVNLPETATPPAMQTLQLRCPLPCPTYRNCLELSIYRHFKCDHTDSLAERSKALAQGASPQGRGFEPHSCHVKIHGTTMGV